MEVNVRIPKKEKVSITNRVLIKDVKPGHYFWRNYDVYLDRSLYLVPITDAESILDDLPLLVFSLESTALSTVVGKYLNEEVVLECDELVISLYKKS